MRIDESSRLPQGVIIDPCPFYCRRNDEIECNMDETAQIDYHSIHSQMKKQFIDLLV